MIIPKPNFLIVGAPKCGTTTLSSILKSHPDCCMGEPKEVCFFQDIMDFKINENYQKGWHWYQQAFEHYNGERLIGEATPSYADRYRSPNTASRIFEFNRKMKIIYMVRNPIERQISCWKMQYYEGKNGFWKDRIETQWALKGFNYWNSKQKDVGQWSESQYHYQLESYLNLFHKDQILVTFLEDWQRDQIGEVDKVLRFLNLETTISQDQKLDQKNSSTRTILSKPNAKLMNNRMFKLISNITPIFIKNQVIKSVLLRKFEYPAIDQSSLRDFANYVEADASLFLNYNNKPNNFWQL